MKKKKKKSDSVDLEQLLTINGIFQNFSRTEIPEGSLNSG